MKWENLAIESTCWESAKQELDELGSMGFELVSVVFDGNYNRHEGWSFFLKRGRPDEECPGCNK